MALKNPQHQLAVEYYLQTSSQVDAYVRAGFSEKNADAHASRFFNRPEVREELQSLQAALNVKATASREQMLGVLENIALSQYQPPSARVSAVVRWAKMTGNDRPAPGAAKHTHADLAKLSDDELMDAIGRRLGASVGADNEHPKGESQ